MSCVKYKLSSIRKINENDRPIIDLEYKHNQTNGIMTHNDT